MTPAEQVATVYWGTFSAAPRYATHKGKHWQPQQGTPTIDTIIAVLTGDGAPLSVFFLGDDSASHVFAIDIDDEDGWTAVEQIARQLVDAGVACYTERSRRGGHVWIVADKVIPAIVGRRAIHAAVEAAGLDPDDKHVEIRPNTDRHTTPYAGGSLRAPWMAHPATGERYGLLDPITGRRLHQKVAGALLALELADHRALVALAERFVPRFVAPPTAPPKAAPSGRDNAELLRALGVDPGRGRGVTRCPAHPDEVPSLSWRISDQGRLLLHCHAGCSFADIVSAGKVAA